MTPDEYYFEEGCFIVELHNTPADPAVSVARARVEPGRTTRWHSLAGIEERYLIVQGAGRVEVGDRAPREVRQNDVVRIPAGCRQRIANAGPDDLVFLAICTPRFVPAAYCDLDRAEPAP
ncbi:cupin domain-containing protein [Desulfobulbus sp.]|uniref:cupin domain-containing protein n=1 Tax=Desulfobulbus sp. TaxID=895 RepID=UPI00286F7630|nr:cupin domain-containing protein [Desulfobulbus sp.]